MSIISEAIWINIQIFISIMWRSQEIIFVSRFWWSLYWSIEMQFTKYWNLSVYPSIRGNSNSELQTLTNVDWKQPTDCLIGLFKWIFTSLSDRSDERRRIRVSSDLDVHGIDVNWGNRPHTHCFPIVLVIFFNPSWYIWMLWIFFFKFRHNIIDNKRLSSK